MSKETRFNEARLNQEHLTDEQWTAALTQGSLSGDLRRHLETCGECQAEKLRMETLVAGMRTQVAGQAKRPSAFWDWQLQNTLRRARPRRVTLVPALAGTLALLAVALLLLQRPATTAAPDFALRAARATIDQTAPAAVSPTPIPESLVQSRARDSETQRESLGNYAMSDDDALLAAVTRAMQGPPTALQPAALLAQELVSAQMMTAPGAGSTDSKGEIQ
jgi:hypothetical protein